MSSQARSTEAALILLNQSLAPIVTMSCLRSAVELRLFDLIPETGAVSLAKLAELSRATEDLLFRLLSPLVCSGIFVSPSSAMYGHTSSSLGFRQPTIRAALLHGFDEVLPCFLVQHRWFTENGWSSPESPNNCPFSMIRQGDSLFGHLAKHPEKAAVFDTDQELDTTGIVGLFPFDHGIQWANLEDVFVDVGGGKGQASRALVEAYPQLHRRIVLQDQEEVLLGVSENTQTILKEMIPYSFFEPQPVKGAAIYYLRRITCDWPDASCIDILRRQAEAMDSHSRLLIATLVVPEKGSNFHAAVSDVVMMTYAGRERTGSQFRQILESAGLSLIKVWQNAGEVHSVLEAQLA